MESKLLELLVNNLEKEVEDRLRFLGSGAAKSYDEYKEVCGAIRGLQTAQREAQDLVRRAKEIDNE